MCDGIDRAGLARRFAAVLTVLCLSTQVNAWTDGAVVVTTEAAVQQDAEGVRLPDEVTFHSATDGAYYLKIPVAHARSLIKPAVNPRATMMAEWAANESFAAVINGGFFIADDPVSLVVRDGELLAENVATVTRNGLALPVRRSAFWIDRDGVARAGWVARDEHGALRAFSEPLPYRAGNPELGPQAATGAGEFIDPHWAIGGGPRLVEGGEVSISFAEEVFWGSGVTLEETRPRSAICVTGADEILLFITPAARLDALAQQLQKLGCREAVNLDGGGSSAMYVAGEKILDQERPVPAVLTVLREVEGVPASADLGLGH